MMGRPYDPTFVVEGVYLRWCLSYIVMGQTQWDGYMASKRLNNEPWVDTFEDMFHMVRWCRECARLR